MIRVSEEQIAEIKAADPKKLSCGTEEGMGNLFMGMIVLEGKGTSSKTVGRSNYDYPDADEALDAAEAKLEEVLEEKPETDEKEKKKKAAPKKKMTTKKTTTKKKATKKKKA